MTPVDWKSLAALLLAAALLASVGAPAASAQPYPTKEVVRLIVPFVPGGGVDAVARVLQPLLTDALGQTVVIENRGGAGGALGAAAVAKAAPDGYTLLLGTGSTHGTNSAVYPKLTYDPISDFTPVVLVSSSPLLLVTGPDFPAKTAADLVAIERAQPGKLNYGSFGTGSINHLAGELFNAMAGIQANHIPYRGSAPAQTDLMAGRLQFMFSSGSALLSYFQANTMKLLGVAGEERWPVLPSYPTISESGVPGYEASVWYGLFAPANTPRPIVDLLNSKMNAVLADTKVAESFSRFGIHAQGGPPEALGRRVHSEIKKWADLVRDKNIRVDP